MYPAGVSWQGPFPAVLRSVEGEVSHQADRLSTRRLMQRSASCLFGINELLDVLYEAPFYHEFIGWSHRQSLSTEVRMTQQA